MHLSLAYDDEDCMRAVCLYEGKQVYERMYVRVLKFVSMYLRFHPFGFAVRSFCFERTPFQLLLLLLLHASVQFAGRHTCV